MSVHALTDWDVGVWSNRKLFHNTLRVNLCLPKMTPHLSRGRLTGPVGSSNLDSMVLCLIRSDRFDVCCDLAILQLQQKTRSDLSSARTKKRNAPVGQSQEP